MGTITFVAQSRGLQRCSPEDRDFVEEELFVAGRGTLRYRQKLGQFSNPNPYVAVSTAEWLLEVVRGAVNTVDGTPSTDLLELYCGAGSHTVALAPLFRHVLAVEINRQLVDAANTTWWRMVSTTSVSCAHLRRSSAS